MILVGACWRAEHFSGAVAIVESSLKRGQKRYAVEKIHEGRYAGAEAFSEAVASFSEGGNLRRTKRLFSQDRRPAKTIVEPPKVVVFHDGSPMTQTLRTRGTVVEAVRFLPGKAWKKGRVGRALGADYSADPAEVFASAARVIEEGRIVPVRSVGRAGPEKIFRQIAVFPATPSGKLSAGMLAVALPLWFRETIPYRRAYRAR